MSGIDIQYVEVRGLIFLPRAVKKCLILFVYLCGLILYACMLGIDIVCRGSWPDIFLPRAVKILFFSGPDIVC